MQLTAIQTILFDLPLLSFHRGIPRIRKSELIVICVALSLSLSTIGPRFPPESPTDSPLIAENEILAIDMNLKPY